MAKNTKNKKSKETTLLTRKIWTFKNSIVGLLAK